MSLFGMTNRRRPLFDESVPRLPNASAGQSAPGGGMPGVVSGYGGGTFDIGGMQVTPNDPNEIRYTPAAQRAMDNAPRTQDDKPQISPSYWEGGDKFTLRDGLAAGLSALGDGFSDWANGGGRGGSALQTLVGRRLSALDQAKQARAQAEAAAEAERVHQQRRGEQFDDKVRWAEYERANPEPADFEEYAKAFGLEEGTDEYFKAVEDYVLRSSGPTAHRRDLELDDYRTANDERMENLRFGNRQKMEGLRQGNRLETIQNRPAPAPRGGSRPSGGGGNLPIVSSPAEAARLPKGTRFRTPDGRVKVVP